MCATAPDILENIHPVITCYAYWLTMADAATDDHVRSDSVLTSAFDLQRDLIDFTDILRIEAI